MNGYKFLLTERDAIDNSSVVCLCPLYSIWLLNARLPYLWHQHRFFVATGPSEQILLSSFHPGLWHWGALISEKKVLKHLVLYFIHAPRASILPMMKSVWKTFGDFVIVEDKCGHLKPSHFALKYCRQFYTLEVTACWQRSEDQKCLCGVIRGSHCFLS